MNGCAHRKAGAGICSGHCGKIHSDVVLDEFSFLIHSSLRVFVLLLPGFMLSNNMLLSAILVWIPGLLSDCTYTAEEGLRVGSIRQASPWQAQRRHLAELGVASAILMNGGNTYLCFVKLACNLSALQSSGPKWFNPEEDSTATRKAPMVPWLQLGLE